MLNWYRKHARALPWRETTEPYPVLVSELMLQQTRVATALPYYQRWMKQFPTVQALAAAPEQQVMAAWSGLGYYRRARFLHAAAKSVASDGWPKQLQDLPGVGPYTAAAVGSICFNQPTACVDGNVRRVVSRHFAELDERAVEQRAQDWLDPNFPGDWNQAVMELGATLCTPTAPRCTECPVQSTCQAENPEAYPAPKTPTVQRRESIRLGIVERDGKVMLQERPAGLLAGTYLPPEVEGGNELGSFTHMFSHRIWEVTVARIDAGDGPWFPIAELHALPLSSVARKALALANVEQAVPHTANQ